MRLNVAVTLFLDVYLPRETVTGITERVVLRERLVMLTVDDIVVIKREVDISFLNKHRQTVIRIRLRRTSEERRNRQTIDCLPRVTILRITVPGLTPYFSAAFVITST